MKHMKRLLATIVIILTLSVGFRAEGQGMYGPQMAPPPVDRRDFAALVDVVRQQTFASSQLPMIQVAGLAGWFTCGQCSVLMNLFSFDDNKLQVVRYLAAHLVNPSEWQPIINSLSFYSNQQKAKSLILTRGASENENVDF